MIHYPRIEIQFCTKCRWNLRAAWYLQELLSTFGAALGEVALVPADAGVFRVRLQVRAGSNDVVLWDRKQRGGFPDSKELKQLVRDEIEPGRDLGHSDREPRSEGVPGNSVASVEVQPTEPGLIEQTHKDAKLEQPPTEEPKSDIGPADDTNHGQGNRGIGNTGNNNVGNYNIGNDNCGNNNQGNGNRGNSNQGNSNQGNGNNGYGNMGNANHGNENRGNSNVGNQNHGNANHGNNNRGNANKGNNNHGNNNKGNNHHGNNHGDGDGDDSDNGDDLRSARDTKGAAAPAQDWEDECVECNAS